MTFDFGYEGGYTAQILDTLRDKGVKAVFFLVGSYISSNPDLVKRIQAEGHLVGNHSYDHTYLDVLLEDSPEGLIEDLKQWDRVFGSSVKLYRPSAGVYTERAMAILRDLGYETLFWGAAYRDWVVDDQPERDEALQTIKSRTKAGDIVLLHGFQANAEILGEYIDWIRANGWQLSLPPLNQGTIQN